jgi:site-specific recombinase XerD
MDRFLLAIAPLGPDEVGGSDVAEWANELARKGLADATVAARLAAISSFYQFCMTTYTDAGGQPLTRHNPVAIVERPRVEKYGNSRPLTIEQLRDLLGVIDRSTIQGMRDYAMILIAVYTGRRSAEVRGLRIANIQHFSNGQLRYCWKGKRGKMRWDDLPAPVYQAMQLYLEAAGRGGLGLGLGEPMFIAHNGHDVSCRPLCSEFFNQMVKGYAKAAGLPEWVHTHTLRHTASALRLSAGRSVLEISRLLGHSSLQVTQIYIEAMTGFEDDGWQDVERVLDGARQGK